MPCFSGQYYLARRLPALQNVHGVGSLGQVESVRNVRLKLARGVPIQQLVKRALD